MIDEGEIDCEIPTKAGWVWKYSVGKSFFGLKNWKMRYLVCSIDGLAYFAQEPFVKPKGQIAWADVTYVYDNISPNEHAEAKEKNKFYFGLRFCSAGQAEHVLLLRSDTERERSEWTLHIAAMKNECDQLRMFGDTDEDNDDAPVKRQKREEQNNKGILEAMRAKLRNMVSLKKQRFQKDGMDLDLAYILPNVIAMGFPAEGKEELFRNPMSQVVSFFDTYHKSHYKVYNLCSERAYPPSRFGGSFERFPFDDHNPCPIEMLTPMCQSMHKFITATDKVEGAPPITLGSGCSDLLAVDLAAAQQKPANVVAVHCKAGKGRTGLAVCAYLLYCGACKTPQEALKVFGDRRTKDGKGLQIPSQKRYLHYFHTLLTVYHNIIPPVTAILVRSLTLSSTPHMDVDGGCDPYIIIEGRKKGHGHVPCGQKEGNFSKPMEVLYDSRKGATVQHIVGQSNFCIPINTRITTHDEILFRAYDADMVSQDDKMFTFWVHAAFLPMNGMLKLTKHELDDATKDKANELFDEDFYIILEYSIG